MGKRNEANAERERVEALRKVVTAQTLDSAAREDVCGSRWNTCARQLQALALAEIAELLRFLTDERARNLPDREIHHEAKRRMMLPSDHELPPPMGD